LFKKSREDKTDYLSFFLLSLLFYGIDAYEIILEKNYEDFCDAFYLDLTIAEEALSINSIKKIALEFLKIHLKNRKTKQWILYKTLRVHKSIRRFTA